MQYSDLSQPQREIVDVTERRIVVLAGPGTGKTGGGMMLRVQRLLDGGVSPDAIMLVTFTRTAAQDLKEKLEKQEGVGAKHVLATTLHSLCLSILRDQDVFRLFGRRERFLLNHEQRLMLYDLEGDFGTIRDRVKRLIAYQSGWLTNPGSYYGGLPDKDSLTFGDQVQRWLVSHGAMLIGEVVPLTFDFLRDNAVRTKVDHVEHLFVDEYQDLNYLEQQLLEFIVEDKIDMLIIGDDDQSIYGFKHAHPDGILDQVEREDSYVITLDECRRSPSNIVTLANQLIGHDPGRMKHDLKPTRAEQGYLAKIQWSRFEDEVQGISAAIAYDVTQRSMPIGEILVLVPNRRIGIKVRDELISLDIPAKGYFDQELFDDSVQGRKAMALLQLSADDQDMIAWRVIFGLNDSQGRAEKYRNLRAEAARRRLSVVQLLENMADGDRLRFTYRKFTELFNDARRTIKRLQHADPVDIIDAVFPDSDSSLRELREAALSSLSTNPGMDIQELASEMVTRLSFNDVDQTPDFVRVMTLHKSKGLTANQVFITSLVEGVLPNYIGIESDEQRPEKVTESRRLLYVGVTRSASELVLSAFRSVPVGNGLKFGIGPTSPSSHSRFTALSSSLMRELGAEGGRVIAGEDWLLQYTQRE